MKTSTQLHKEFTAKNMQFKNVKEFWKSFSKHISDEEVIEEIKIRNNYISALVRGRYARVRYYYTLEAGILIENTRRR